MKNHIKPRKVSARKNYARPTIRRAKPEEVCLLPLELCYLSMKYK